MKDSLRDWWMEGGSLQSGDEGSLHPNSGYGRVSADGSAVLSNLGFNGRKTHGNECAMSTVAEREYEFSCWLRLVDFQGSLSLRVADGAGQTLTETVGLKADAFGGAELPDPFSAKGRDALPQYSGGQ